MTWLRHFRRAFSTAVIWGVLWAPLGVLTGMIWDPNDSMDEPWIALGAYPGFLCGLLFCTVLAITEHPFWQWRFMIVGAVVLLSSLSAVGSVLLARKADKRDLHGSSGAL